MTNIQKIESILMRIEELLVYSSTGNWIGSIKRLKHEVSINPQKAVSDILGMYGGLGSFNDIVLYRDGEILRYENIELEDLRTKLYDLCIGERGCSDF